VQALGCTAEAAFFKDYQQQAQFFDHGCKGDARIASLQSPIGIICPRSPAHLSSVLWLAK
jgi:hypothetical protein